MAEPPSRVERHRVLAWAVAALLLASFAVLALLVHRDATLAIDLALLTAVREAAGSAVDRPSNVVSQLGHEWGVVPLDVVLVLALLLSGRIREGLFAGLALGGSGLLNVAAKHGFARTRPALWESIAPEHNFSFPSGHAMGSMTLATVLVLLAWPTRWRRAVSVAAALFVAAVGLSRVQLGVHYPSDVLAGWLLAAGWALALHAAFFRGGRVSLRRTPPGGTGARCGSP